MTTELFNNTTMQRACSSPGNATVWSSEDLTTASSRTDERIVTTITLNQPDQTNSPLDYVSMYLNMLFIPVGLILNVQCIAVLIKTIMARTSTAVEMVFLALADSINLITQFVLSSPVWSQYSDIPDLTIINDIMCAGTFYLALVGSLLSGMIMSVATIERFCFVTFPLRIKTGDLYKKSKMVLLVLLVISLVLPIFHFWCYDLLVINDAGLTICLTTPIVPIEMCTISRVVLMIILINIIPGLVILAFSILTGVGLYRSRARSQETGLNNNNSNDKRKFRITTMLLTEATIFLLSCVPFAIMVEINHIYHNRNPVLMDVLSSLSFLTTLNHSTNFVVYMIFLQQFRRSFAKMMLKMIGMMSNCFRCLFIKNKSPTAHDLVANRMEVDGNDYEVDVVAIDIASDATNDVMDARNETTNL